MMMDVVFGKNSWIDDTKYKHKVVTVDRVSSKTPQGNPNGSRKRKAADCDVTSSAEDAWDACSVTELPKSITYFASNVHINLLVC